MLSNTNKFFNTVQKDCENIKKSIAFFERRQVDFDGPNPSNKIFSEIYKESVRKKVINLKKQKEEMEYVISCVKYCERLKTNIE